MTEAEVQAYLASDEHAEYVKSELFMQRGVELDRRLQTEPLTVEQAAEIVALPVDVFRHLYGHYLALEAIKEKSGTEQ